MSFAMVMETVHAWVYNMEAGGADDTCVLSVEATAACMMIHTAAEVTRHGRVGRKVAADLLKGRVLRRWVVTPSVSQGGIVAAVAMVLGKLTEV
jgi:hypothetical protein